MTSQHVIAFLEFLGRNEAILLCRVVNEAFMGAETDRIAGSHSLPCLRQGFKGKLQYASKVM